MVENNSFPTTNRCSTYFSSRGSSNIFFRLIAGNFYFCKLFRGLSTFLVLKPSRSPNCSRLGPEQFCVGESWNLLRSSRGMHLLEPNGLTVPNLHTHLQVPPTTWKYVPSNLLKLFLIFTTQTWPNSCLHGLLSAQSLDSVTEKKFVCRLWLFCRSQFTVIR